MKSFLFSLGFVAAICDATKPAPAQYFHHQLMDHVDPYGDYRDEEWTQRYYIWDEHFQGPGSPIFLIFGGEGQIPPEKGLMYPFVTDHLAETFKGYVLQPEHRFYGESQPLYHHHPDKRARQDPRVHLFTPEQALHDAMHLLTHIQEKLGCSKDKFSSEYCPVITVGGSYPGWLSAMARVVFPYQVDMSYAGSAPMTFYSQQVDVSAYYNHITKVADKMLPGCADAVRTSLYDIKTTILSGGLTERNLGICEGTIPDYIDTKTPEGLQMLVDEIMMVVGYTFANDNMANYPPGNTTRLFAACQTFTSDKNAFHKLQEFLVTRLREGEHCWAMTGQLPAGPNATITSGDWSGVGTGTDGDSWDFQTCTLLVEAIGFSNSSMFPPREWSRDWLTDHCQMRYRVTPDPYALVYRWKFDDLAKANVTRILFTNGLNDGWSVGGIQSNLSNSLLALNFPNGAHHSDLSGRGPSEDDTADIKQGFKSVIQILGSWLDEIRPPVV
jgi:hypothetical protein